MPDQLPDDAVTAAAEAIHFSWIGAAADEPSCLCLPEHPTARYDHDRERAIRALEAAAPAIAARAAAAEREACVREVFDYAENVLTSMMGAVYRDAARLLFRGHPDVERRVTGRIGEAP